MEFTAKQKQELKEGFKNALAKKDILEEEYKKKHPDLYNEIVKDYLVVDGFPESVNKEKVDYSFILTSEPETMFDILSDRDVIEDEQQYLSVVNDPDFFIDNITDVPMYLQPSLSIRTTAEEYLQKYPTKEYLSERISNKYEEKVFDELLKAVEEVKTEVKEKAMQDGFKNDVDLDKLRYSLNPSLINGYEGLAQDIISQSVIGESNNVDNFLDEELYNYIYNNDLYKLDIRIDDTPEEYEEI